jgi:hypothetical protein
MLSVIARLKPGNDNHWGAGTSRPRPLATACGAALHLAQGRLAQLVEHLVYTERVGGSSPSPPTNEFKDLWRYAEFDFYKKTGWANVIWWRKLAGRSTLGKTEPR